MHMHLSTEIAKFFVTRSKYQRISIKYIAFVFEI